MSEELKPRNTLEAILLILSVLLGGMIAYQTYQVGQVGKEVSDMKVSVARMEERINGLSHNRATIAKQVSE